MSCRKIVLPGLLACMLLTCMLPAFAAVPFWGAREASPPGTAPSELRPGEFVWTPEDAPQGPILVVVALEEQRAHVYRNGVSIGYASVSSGKAGHETPTGVFQTLQKDATHRSSTYNNAPMPYTQRLTWDGVALHAGGLPGYPSSHGCVHLPSEFARRLFEVSPLGMTVVVAKGAEAPVPVRHPTFLSPVDARGQVAAQPRLDADQEFRWEPARSAEGPLSLVLSTREQRVVVMRNGVEIGRARVRVRGDVAGSGTHLYLAHRDASTQDLVWRSMSIGATSGVQTHEHAADGFAMPHAFSEQLLPLLDEGTSLVVTDAEILPHTTGQLTTVLSSHPLASN
ncbi:MAG TPA: L,D-transpeptidase [Xanthomonadaceae bacterium]